MGVVDRSTESLVRREVGYMTMTDSLGIPAPGQTNLLVVIADQWRHSALGLLGQDPVQTPHLDGFASESVILSNAVSNYPVCSPYRGMLLSGQYPATNGVTANCNSRTAPKGIGLKSNARCWSDVLADAGYQCGYIGKWHLDPPTNEDALYGEGPQRDGVVWDCWTPPERRHGFDFWYAYGCCNRHLRPHYWVGDAPREEPTQVDRWSAEHETDVAIDFIQGRDRTRPFALVLSYNPPHMPFHEVPERYLDHYRTIDPRELLVRPNVHLDSPAGRLALTSVGGYFAAITGVDEQVGRLLEMLTLEGLADDTIVVVTSDHGEMMASHGLMDKRVWYDESLLVPFIVRWPGHLSPRSDDLLLSVPDIYPTLLSLLGLGDLVSDDVQGRDLSAALLGVPSADRPEAALYFSMDVDWLGLGELRGLRTHRWTYTINQTLRHQPSVRLFDNVGDPYQRAEISANHSSLVAELDDLLRDQLRGVEYQ